MTSITTRAYKQHLGNNLLTEIDSAGHNYYFFASKPTPWSDENNPDPVKEVREFEVDVWDNIISLKKIQSSDAVFVIPRVDWDTSGLTIYRPYDSRDIDLFNHPTAAEALAAATAGTYKIGSFYTMNSAKDIYICLDNSRNSRSTIEPTGRSISSFNTADGYTWKYVCSVADSDTTKFLTSDFIPVRNLTSDDGSYQWSVQQTSIDGALESYIIDNAGLGYIAATGTVVSATTNTVTLASTSVATNDYYNGMTIHLSNGERAKIIDYIGVTKQAIVNKNFSVIPTNLNTYEILPTIEIVGDGTGAIVKPVVLNGIITNITIISKGSGYRHATVSVVDTMGSGASIRANIGYAGGLALNPITLLGATSICVNIRLAFDELGFFSDNDYRMFGVIKDVKNTTGNAISSISNAKGTTELSITSLYNTISPDEIMQLSNGAKVRVVSSTSSSVYVIQDSATGYDPIVLGSIKSVSGTGGATITNITLPVIQKYSGDMIFISSRKAVQRSSEQLEDFKLFFVF